MMGRATIERRILELREDFALRKIPTRSFSTNALYLEIIRFAYNLVTAFPADLSSGILAKPDPIQATFQIVSHSGRTHSAGESSHLTATPIINASSLGR